jgi:hypothetical protein
VQEGVKARIGSQRIKPRVNRQENHFVHSGAQLVSLFEPRKGLILSAKSCVRLSKEEGIGLLLLCFQLGVKSASHPRRPVNFVPHRHTGCIASPVSFPDLMRFCELFSHPVVLAQKVEGVLEIGI